MAKLDLTKYGITGATVIAHNPSYEQLFEEETKAGLEGYEKGQQTELGAVNVMTGIYTGRSPKDKYIVMDENSKDTVWWTTEEYKNDNHPMSEQVWGTVKDLAVKELCNKNLYVVDGFCGANKDTRMAVRFIVEVAWQAHFVTNMFIRPTAEELEAFEPDFVVYNASKAKVENYKELGLNSETCVAFNVTSIIHHTDHTIDGVFHLVDHALEYSIGHKWIPLFLFCASRRGEIVVFNNFAALHYLFYTKEFTFATYFTKIFLTFLVKLSFRGIFRPKKHCFAWFL